MIRKIIMLMFLISIAGVIFLGLTNMKNKNRISYPNIVEAIEESGYENIEILLQEKNDNIVIFRANSVSGENRLVINKYKVDNEGYTYNSGDGEYSQHFLMSDTTEFINLYKVKGSSKYIFYGWLFDSDNEEKVRYDLYNFNDEIIHSSVVDIKENDIVYETLNLEDEKISKIDYEILKVTSSTN